MLNTTIVALTTALLCGSPFTLSPSKSYRTFSVDKSNFAKSLHTVFYFNSFFGQSKFAKTTFDSIIGGAVRAESAYDVKDQIIEKRVFYTPFTDNRYSFESCMFRNCHITGELNNGGAISISASTSSFDQDVDFSIEFSSFYNCWCAGGQGGAIALTLISDADILHTCFDSCTTREQSETGDFGAGTAVYITHRLNAKLTLRTKSRGSSYNKCPSTGVMNPNTQSVFYSYQGEIDIDHSNFTQNFVEKSAAALLLFEPKTCFIDYLNLINQTGEYTVYISSQSDSSCDINTVNFVYCNQHADAKSYKGVLAGLHTQITIEDSVFILGSNQYLATKTHTSDTSRFTFSKCVFDQDTSFYQDPSICTFNSCSKSDNPATNDITFFDSRECWEIEPERLPASDSVYAFFLVFAVFAGLIGFGLYLQITQFTGGNATISEKYDAAPAIAEPINKAAYDAIPE